MLIDILGQDNNVSFNYKIANKIGLNNAIYLSELMRQYSKALNHGKMNGEYFTIDRVRIFERTTLTEQLQQDIDVILVRLNIMLKRASTIDPLAEECTIDMKTVIELFASDNEKINKDLKKLSDAKTAPKMSQRDKYKQELKAHLKCSNKELLYAYRDWVDGVYANPKGFLSQKAISIFQETVDKFAQGDLDLALKIIDIATVQGYRDATWAINLFKKDYEKDFYREHSNQVQNNSIREVQLSSEVF